MKLKFSTLVIITLVLIVAIVAAAKIGSPDHQGYTEEQETKNSEGNTTSNHIENIETTTSAQKVTESTVVKEETEPKTSIPVTVPQTNVEQILKDGNFNYYIYIELGSGTLTIYEKSGAESFDKVIHCSPVSAGLGGSTPVGIFHIKERKDWLEMESDGYVQYATLWDRGVIISSSLYETQDRNTLVRKSYLGLGQPSTKGNILTTAGTAYWIMQNSSENTLLHIVEGSPKQIVSDPLPELNPEYVFTDPTDPLYRTLEELEKEGELPYSLYLEKGSFTLTVYKKDENGEYTVPVKAFRTAVGRTAGRTPVGNFAVYKKERWHEFPYNGGYAQYATAYYGNLYIHSPIFSLPDTETMLVSLYNEIGTNATAGCLRTTSYAAYWVYSYCPIGTPVEIVNGSSRGTVSEKPPTVDDVYMTKDPTDPFNPDSVY